MSLRRAAVYVVWCVRASAGASKEKSSSCQGVLTARECTHIFCNRTTHLQKERLQSFASAAAGSAQAHWNAHRAASRLSWRTWHGSGMRAGFATPDMLLPAMSGCSIDCSASLVSRANGYAGAQAMTSASHATSRECRISSCTPWLRWK